jgi:hypothetical protein
MLENYHDRHLPHSPSPSTRRGTSKEQVPNRPPSHGADLEESRQAGRASPLPVYRPARQPASAGFFRCRRGRGRAARDRSPGPAAHRPGTAHWPRRSHLPPHRKRSNNRMNKQGTSLEQAMNRSPSQQRPIRPTTRLSPSAPARSACLCGNESGERPPFARHHSQWPGDRSGNKQGTGHEQVSQARVHSQD